MTSSADNLHAVPARVVLGLLLVLLGFALGGGAGAATSGPTVSASAFAVRVVLPDGNVATAGAISAPPQAAASLDGYAYGDGAVTTGAIAAGTRGIVEGGRALSTSDTSVDSVSLFGGELTIGSIRLAAVSRASATRAGGQLSRSALSDVLVFGQPVAPGPNARVPLGDWGYAVLLEQAVVREQGKRLGQRRFVTGVHVHVTADHGGLPAGSEILVGYAEAAASAPKSAPLPPQPGPEPDASTLPQEPLPPPPGAQPPAPPPIVKDPPAGVEPQLTTQGYVFPVYGPASFSDDFGAGRAIVGWHHGNDIFAPLGAPVVAVADGTLFLVGWNTIGGNRLWLRDAQGNEFYYAHLSAYSPLALEGARVKAGDVIGFVGTTGDAVGTPPHLHFEIHPAQLLWLGYDGVVNPFAHLSAWRRLLDEPFDVAAWQPPPGKAPPAAAVLLLAEDISTVSGLAAEGFAGLLELPDFGEGPPGPAIVNAEPGFGA